MVPRPQGWENPEQFFTGLLANVTFVGRSWVSYEDDKKGSWCFFNVEAPLGFKFRHRRRFSFDVHQIKVRSFRVGYGDIFKSKESVREYRFDESRQTFSEIVDRMNGIVICEDRGCHSCDQQMFKSPVEFNSSLIRAVTQEPITVTAGRGHMDIPPSLKDSPEAHLLPQDSYWSVVWDEVCTVAG